MGNLVKETPYSEITATLEALDHAGVTRESLTNVRKDVELAKKISALLVSVSATAGNLFKTIVDYSRSLKEMIADGNYDWVDSDITEKRFPIPKPPSGLPTKVELNLELIHFNRNISSNNAITELKKKGLRPATLPELLAFGATYPEKQREFPIVALGSVWRHWSGDRKVLCLWSGSVERDLRLDWFGFVWDGNCRFLAVRGS